MFGPQPPALATLFLEMGQWEGLGSPQNIASLPPSSSPMIRQGMGCLPASPPCLQYGDEEIVGS